MADTLDDIASELYALPPVAFTAARDAAAARVGDAALAREVRALRKPVVAAWIINLFARERRDQLAEALTLAQDLRAAQQQMDAAALTTLGRQRRQLVRHLAAEATGLAEEHAVRVSPATAGAVEQTLNAAMFDEFAALAVASGRLMKPLEASAGFPQELLDDAVAGSTPVVAAPDGAPGDERARREAEAELTAAEQEHAALREDRAAVAAEAATLTQRVAALEEQLAAAREDLRAAERRRIDLERQADDNDKRLRRARRAVDQGTDA